MSKDLNLEIKENFLDYSHEVNAARAFPNVIDGLKPGQRAILWEMFFKGFTSNKPHVKCAKIVGSVISDLHPHGDQAVYETLARMSQGWINNLPEVDWHGANGSVQISAEAASSRYTESRLSKSTEDGMFSNIKKNVVPLKWNFSEDIEWGEYLPAIYPRLLVNGSQGIGSTIANHWTLFNLGEACAVIEKYLTTGELDYSTFYPDYPSGGIIINQKDLSKIHATGKGKVILRGTTEIKDDIIYITELPYQTYVEPLIEDIKKLVIAEEIPDIINILNKSDKKHLLIEIECERGKAQKVLNQLFAKTDLQKSFSPNQWGIVKKVPQLLTLKEYLDCFIEYNLGYIKKENEFDYNKAKERQEIVEGLLKALENIDNIITLIKKSNSSKDAIKGLMETYEFTEKQATAIVNMKLGKLAQLEKVELNKEAEELNDTITNCLSIINDREKQKAIYLEKLKSFCKKYATPRKTKVIQLAGGNDPTPAEPCFIVARESGNVSYDAEMDIKTQRRNGKGAKVENDKVIYAAKGNTKQVIYGFTANGKVFNKPQPVDNRFVSFVPDSDDKYLYFLTKQGIIKKALFEDYRKLSKNDSIAIKLKENDEVVRVISTNKESIAIFTHDGYLLKTDNIPTSSRTAMGVKGIKLGEGDYPIAISAANEVLIGMEDGKGKTLNIEKNCCQSRGGKGIKYSSSTVGSVVDMCGEKAIIYGSERQICIDIQNLSAKTALIKDSDIKMITMLGE